MDKMKMKMKKIREQAQKSVEILDNAAQMNKVEQKAGRIYERNPDTDQIRSRKSGDHGNERIENEESETVATDMNNIPYTEEDIDGNIDVVMDKVIHPLRKRIREEVLDELWAADKTLKDGHWNIRLSDAIKIISGEI